MQKQNNTVDNTDVRIEMLNVHASNSYQNILSILFELLSSLFDLDHFTLQNGKQFKDYFIIPTSPSTKGLYNVFHSQLPMFTSFTLYNMQGVYTHNAAYQQQKFLDIVSMEGHDLFICKQCHFQVLVGYSNIVAILLQPAFCR